MGGASGETGLLVGGCAVVEAGGVLSDAAGHRDGLSGSDLLWRFVVADEVDPGGLSVRGGDPESFVGGDVDHRYRGEGERTVIEVRGDDRRVGGRLASVDRRRTGRRRGRGRAAGGGR